MGNTLCSGCQHGERVVPTAAGHWCVWAAKGQRAAGAGSHAGRILPELTQRGFCAGRMQRRVLLKEEKKKIEPIIWSAVTISLFAEFVGEGWCRAVSRDICNESS